MWLRMSMWESKSLVMGRSAGPVALLTFMLLPLKKNLSFPLSSINHKGSLLPFNVFFFSRNINVDSKGRCGCLLMYYGTLVRSLLQVNNTTAEVIGCFF